MTQEIGSEKWQIEFAINFEYVQRQAHATAVQKGFWDPPKSPGESIALMHSELSELLEVYRSGTESECNPKVQSHTNAEVELADLIIRVMDFAEYHELDLVGAILAKMAYNETRPKKHGKRF